MVSGGLLGATLSFSGQWFRSALSIFELAFWLSLQVMPDGSHKKRGLLLMNGLPVSVPAPAALLGPVPEVGLDAALVQRHRRRPHVVARVEPES